MNRFIIEITAADGADFPSTLYVTDGTEKGSYWVSPMGYDDDTIGCLFHHDDAEYSGCPVYDGPAFLGCYYTGEKPARSDFVTLSNFGAC